MPSFGSDPWVIEIRGVDPNRIGINETILALSNGRLGVRGSFEQGAPVHQPGTLINGFYETWDIEYPEPAYGYATSGQTIVYVPDATILKVVGLSLDDADVRRRLDFRKGVLTTIARWPDRTITWERLVSLSRPNIVAFRFRSTKASARVVSGWRNRQDTDYLDGAQAGFDPRKAKSFGRRVLVPLATDVKASRAIASFRTDRSDMAVSLAMEYEAEKDQLDEEVASLIRASLDTMVSPDHVEVGFQVSALEKKVAYLRGPNPEPAIQELAVTPDFTHLAAEQEADLTAFWEVAAIEVGDDGTLQQAVNWLMFQLYQAGARVEASGIPAKGLTGQTYDGHYFWDTDIFVLPFLANASPKSAEQLIRFRYSLLPKARERARTMSEKGALYPWRTINGEEASAYYEAGTAQYHINGAVIYGLDYYLAATGDNALLWECGVEMAVETARLWTSLGFFLDDVFHIHMVTGPDEYSALVDDNAYTNLIARFNLRRAAQWARLMRDEQPDAFAALAARIDLGLDEIDEWERIAASMYIPFDRDRGLTPQDSRFLEREPWHWDTPLDQYPLLLHFHPLVIYRHQVLKQADVVMAMFLFPWEFDAELARANFAYYDPITTGDSSLSPPIQAAVAARLGETELSVEYFRHAALLDLADIAGNAADGVHLATAGGVWHALVGGFGGLTWREGTPVLNPHLPPSWPHLRFSIRVGGTVVRVNIDSRGFTVHTDPGHKAQIEIQGELRTIDSNLARFKTNRVK